MGDARESCPALSQTCIEFVMFYLKVTPARRRFKKRLGNANHLLVTILVGLDAVESGVVAAAPEHLHAAWNPKDARASAGRSPALVLGMVLVRAVDSLEAFICDCADDKAVMSDPRMRQKIEDAGNSVTHKFR